MNLSKLEVTKQEMEYLNIAVNIGAFGMSKVRWIGIRSFQPIIPKCFSLQMTK